MNHNKQQGFTLIELVMVIVILGILAATAIPKFVDLTSEADEAVADGVFGAANSAAAINFAAVRVGSVATLITDDPAGATYLLGLLDVPAGWAAGAGPGGELSITVGGTTYTIDIGSAETTTSKASLGKSW